MKTNEEILAAAIKRRRTWAREKKATCEICRDEVDERSIDYGVCPSCALDIINPQNYPKT